MKPTIAASGRLLLPAFLILAACGKEAPPPAPKPRAVLVHEVQANGAGRQTAYSGEVRARHEVALAFRVGGKLAARLVEVGQQVTPGQVLARLDAGDFALNARGAEASLAAVAAERGLAEAEVKRYRDLRAQNFVSAALLDAKETALKAAEEKYKALSTQAGLARNQTGYAELRSDAAGVVAAVLAEAGQVVAAGQAVVRVAKSGEREVVIAVPENRVDELARAGDLAVSLWALPDVQFRGRVREIAPQADPVTRTFAARVSILDANAQVRLGQTARVSLQTPGANVLIPAGSVFQRGKQPAVWLLGADGRVHLQAVTVAAWHEDGVAVSAGLQAGNRIVAAGAHKLTEGEAVRVLDGGRL